MDEKEPPDIYQTGQRSDSGEEQHFSEDAPFRDPFRMGHVYHAFLLIAFMALIALVGIVLVQQHELRQRPQAPADAPGRPAHPRTERWEEGLEPYRARPAAKAELPPVPEGGAPLDPAWIIEAAYHLERARWHGGEGFHELALHHYREALAIFPDMLAVQEQRGLILLKLGRHQEAIPALKSALQETPDSIQLLNNLAACHLALQDHSAAERLLKRALNMVSTDPGTRYNLALLQLARGELDEAASQVETLLAESPEELPLLRMQAEVLSRQQRWPEAEEALLALSRRLPDAAPIHFQLAQAQARNRRIEPALLSLRAGVARVDVHRALDWLEQPGFDALRELEAFQTLHRELRVAAAD